MGDMGYGDVGTGIGIVDMYEVCRYVGMYGCI